MLNDRYARYTTECTLTEVFIQKWDGTTTVCIFSSYQMVFPLIVFLLIPSMLVNHLWSRIPKRKLIISSITVQHHQPNLLSLRRKLTSPAIPWVQITTWMSHNCDGSDFHVFFFSFSDASERKRADQEPTC